MRALLAAGLLLAAFVMPIRAAASISINEPAPYHVGDVITLTVDTGKLKGYEFPVVLIRCGTIETTSGTLPNWVYYQRWDNVGIPGYPTGPQPITLTSDYIVAPCSLELWAYVGFNGGHVEHVIATYPFTVEP